MTKYLSLIINGYAQNYRGLSKTCWQAISLTFLETICIGICFFLSLYFVDVLHMEMVLVGVMISCYGMGTAAGGIIGGKLSDKISPKFVSIFSLLIQALAFLLLAKLNSVPLLMINLFVLGVSSYGFKTSNDVWMLDQCRQHLEMKLKSINISRVASNLGLGLSGVIIGGLAGYGFQNIFYIFSVLLFISSIYLIAQKRTTNIVEKERNEANAKMQNNLNEQKRNKTIITLMLTCLFLVGLLIAQLSATYPIYVKDTFPQLGVKAVSILFILDTVLIVIFQAPLVNFLNRYNKILITGTGAFLMGIGMLVLSLSSNFALAIISCVIWTTGEMLFVPMTQLVCYERGAEKKKGQTLGIYQSIYACSIIIGPTIGGLIYYYCGGNMLWYLSAAIGVLCLFACSYFRKYD